MKMFKRTLLAATLIATSMSALAMGGNSGPATNYIMQGHIGEIMMNPYGIALPLSVTVVMICPMFL